MSNDPWRNARVMYEKDTCARKMGIELIEMDDGFAQMSMTVSANMLNGHQTCHGGQLFTLADTAFAYACNSQGLAAVASAASIDFLRPAFAGDRLVATARVKQQGKLTASTTSKLLINSKRLWPCSAANRTASAAQSRETCNARRLYL